MDVKLNQHGIFIDGVPQILTCSSLFYFRIPRERWEERIIQLKNAGYTGVDVYFPWNYHEMADGKWDFEGQKDADTFLSLCEKHNLYVIARPGPYICSEWDAGGFPARMFAEGVNVRQHDEKYYQELFKWFDKVIPLIVKHQITRGGSVILFQIENELDFFDCKEREKYMRTLKTKAKDMGIMVPLIACAGQWDKEKATGNVEELYPVFNAYSDWNAPELQEKCMLAYNQLYKADQPLILTETERGHNYLKREVCAGVKLLCSYNQVAGINMEYCNGISNWGWGEGEFPESFMTSDYDFNSMITCSGDVREEYLQARLLNNLLCTFGSRLAVGHSGVADDIEVISEVQDDSLNTCENSFEGGKLYSISNLSNVCGNVQIFRKRQQYSLTLRSGKTVLLPADIDFSYYGSDFVMYFSTAEINYIEVVNGVTHIDLYSDEKCAADFYLKTPCNVCGRGINTIVHGNLHVEKDMAPLTIKGEAVNAQITIRTEKECAYGQSPFLTELLGDLEHQLNTFSINSIEAREFDFCDNKYEESKIGFMEKHEVYRGKAFYKYQSRGTASLMLYNVGDILTIYRNRKVEDVIFSPGSHQIVDVKDGEYIFQTEIWGHANGDDPRYYATTMGSMRGIGKIMEIQSEKNLTQLWSVRESESVQSKFQFYSDINSYVVTKSPLKLVYEKTVKLDTSCDTTVLYFSESNTRCEVLIDGQFAGSFGQNNGYADISNLVAGKEAISLTVTVNKKYSFEHVGDVRLFQGKQISSCEFSHRGIESLPKIEKGDMVKLKLPLHMNLGEQKLLSLDLSRFKEYDLRLEFRGKGIKLDAVHHGTDIGRMLLPFKKPMSVKGGCPDVIMMCSEWLDEPLKLIAQPVENDGVLEEVLVHTVKRLGTEE